jgi:hypothetical protein
MARNPSMMRYKTDTASAALCYLAIAFNVAQFIAFYANNTVAPNLRTGADVVINILFMLVVFWASEMVKVYDRKWAVGLAFIGIIQALRVLWLPAYFHKLEQLVGSSYYLICTATILSGLALAAASALSYANSTILRNYMKTQQ